MLDNGTSTRSGYVASLEIVLKHQRHSSAEVVALMEAVDALPSAAIWAALMYADDADRESELVRARCALTDNLMKGTPLEPYLIGFDGSLKALVRESRLRAGRLLNETDASKTLEIINHITSIDPEDPLDYSMQVGRNAWLRETIRRRDAELFSAIFSFAEVSRLEHRSPLVVELALIFTAAAALPLVLTYGLLRACERSQRAEQELRIRKAEADMKEQEARAWAYKADTMKEVRDGVQKMNLGERVAVPEQAIVASVNLSAPAIAELSKNPLIERVSLSLAA